MKDKFALWKEDLEKLREEIIKKEAVSESDTESIERIASLARKYESNGDPAAVSSGIGDVGGISYGLYQLASNVGSVDEFLAWLVDYPAPELANYGKVLAENPVNSPAFIQTWKDIGTIDPGNFGCLQDEYIKSRYYDTAAKRLAGKYFTMEKHTDALKAVLLSRAVQNGAGGAVELFETACGMLGHPNLSYVDDPYFDGDMIAAIYDFLIAECDAATNQSDVYRSPHGFCNGSAGVISGLKNRFIREKQDALDMLEKN